MDDVGDDTLDEVTGGGWTQALDSGVSWAYPGWNKLSCTSRGLWVGTIAGSATALGAGYVATPLVGSTIAPIAGTLASTQYIEGCEAGQAAKK
jgi:hypothetical protein